MTLALETRRSEATERVTSLREARGRALVAGKPFDGAILAQAEAELAGLDDAEGILVAQQRAAAIAEEAAWRERVRAEIQKAEANRLDACSRAELAGRQMVDAMQEALAAGRRVNAALASLPHSKDQVSESEFANRLSYRLSILLQGLRPGTGHFGALQLRPGPNPKDEPWADAERRASVWIESFTKGARA